MPGLAGVLTYGGSGVAGLSALVAETTTDPAVAHHSLQVGTGALAVAISPVLMTAMRIWLANKREERALKLRLAGISDEIRGTAEEISEAKVVEVRRKVAELDHSGADLTAGLAATAGRLDAVLGYLEQAGRIMPRRDVTGGRSRVLLVGEDAATMRRFADILTALGFGVAEAGTVRGALAILDDPPPPAWVVLNLVLADGDGLEVLRAVREHKLPTRVAVVTRVVDEARLAAVRALGPDLLEHKPADVGRLLKAIDPTLDLSPPEGPP